MKIARKIVITQKYLRLSTTKVHTVVEFQGLHSNYRKRAIITYSRFETALDYKTRILGQTVLVYVLN